MFMPLERKIFMQREKSYNKKSTKLGKNLLIFVWSALSLWAHDLFYLFKGYVFLAPTKLSNTL